MAKWGIGEMARAIRPPQSTDVSAIRAAREHLAAARFLLSHAGAPSALAKVKSAIKSAEGEIRQSKRRAFHISAESR